VQSESLLQPKKRPIAYEAGTPNRIGTASLAAAIEYVLEQKPGALQSLRQQRAAELHEGVCGLDGLHLYGPPPGPRQSGIVCLSIEGMQAGDIAYVLQEAYEVTTRAGLHCAPLMAKAIDAPAGGTLRLSPSPFTTTDEIESACTAIRAIASGI
jgi:selenocysteine lyase/cysteine desulfurase